MKTPVTIELIGDLSEQHLAALRRAWKDRVPVRLLIDSSCHNWDMVNPFLVTMDTFRRQELTITGVVVGYACEAAFMILQDCEKRIAVKSAKLSLSNEGWYTAAEALRFRLIDEIVDSP